MKITLSENNEFQLEEVFTGVTLKTPSGETMSICMRDTGFELNYQGKMYFAKEGYVEPFKKSARDNYLVSSLQKHEETIDVPYCEKTN